MSQARISPALAHILPLAVFMAFLMVPGFIVIDNPLLPWWRHAPEQWVYPLQTVIVGAMLFALRSHYVFKPMRGFGLAVLLGVIGIVLWFAPSLLYTKLIATGAVKQDWWKWLGLAERLKGFDPSFFQHQTFWYVSALIMRFVRMVIVVPLVEELFWRGFLMRYVQADGRSFLKVPFGQHSWPAFAIVTALVVLAHSTEDYLGALIWGSLMYGLAVRTKSLAACVVMHAVGNLLLGIYVLSTKQWGFW